MQPSALFNCPKGNFLKYYILTELSLFQIFPVVSHPYSENPWETLLHLTQ